MQNTEVQISYKKDKIVVCKYNMETSEPDIYLSVTSSFMKWNNLLSKQEKALNNLKCNILNLKQTKIEKNIKNNIK